MFPKLKIGDLIANVPIIQGGMGVGVSVSGLAAAVANEGGIGVISSVALGALQNAKTKLKSQNLQALRNEIAKAKSMTSGILGMNVMVAATDFEDLILTGIKSKIDIIFIGAGLPTKLPKIFNKEYKESIKTKLAPIVSSARAAKLIFKTWEKKYNFVPDAVVVEGPKAGGHLGFSVEQINDPNYSLEKIIPEVVEFILPFKEKYNKDIPIIAGGGIFSGEDIKKIMELGADGVQMGSRFVATNECDASIEFKQQYVDCKKEDIDLIKSPVGLPGRAIFNKFLKQVKEKKRKPVNCPWHCLKSCKMNDSMYCIADALTNACKGKIDDGFCFAGANAYRINKIVSVKELISELRAGFLNSKR